MSRFSRFVNHWRQQSLDREFTDELRFHLEARIDANLRRGMSRADAEAEARRHLGSPLRARQGMRDARMVTGLDGLSRDIRVAVRGLLRVRAYTIGSLASLGIAFAVVALTAATIQVYLLRPLPYPGSERLYRLAYAAPGQPQPAIVRVDWTELGDVVEKVATANIDLFYLTDGRYTTTVDGLRVAPSALQVYAARVTRGRLLTNADVGQRVALITDSLWRSRFGGDEHIVGRTLTAYSANGPGLTETLRIVGVLAPEVWFMRDVEVVVPLDPRARPYLVRLTPGVRPADAERRITEAIKASGSVVPPRWDGARLENLQDSYVARIRPTLNAFAVIMGLGFALACVNVAVLTVLRSIRRQHEFRIRRSLGARSTHLIGIFVAEATTLSILSAGGGLLAARYTLELIAIRVQQQLGVPVPGGVAALTIDGGTAAFVGVVALGVVLVLSGLPWSVLRWPTQPRAVHGPAATHMTRRAACVRSGLVALEIAGALTLLVASGLMVRSVAKLLQTDLGFDVSGVIRAHFALPASQYQEPVTQAQFYDDLMRRVNGHADGVAISNFTAFYEPQTHALEFDEGRRTELRVGAIAVTGRYFDVLQIPVVAGRTFTDADRFAAEPVAIISASLARRLWPGTTAVGRQLRTAEQLAVAAPLGKWRTIVGVAADARQTYEDTDPLDVYLPFLQVPARFASMFIRSDETGAQWMNRLRDILAVVDPNVTVDSARPLAEEAASRLSARRFLLYLLVTVGLFTTCLAVIGVYGAVAYTAEQRRHEVAIRVALGATARSLIRLWLKPASIVLLIGAALGLAGGIAMGRVLRAYIYGIERFDVPTVVASGLLLTSVIAITAAWPVRRVARMNPAVVLKAD